MQQTHTHISTGVPGLDALLRGGIPADRLHLIEGRPGTGKTTLALQFLLAGVREGERAVYVTLSETAAELEAVALSHGWTLDGMDVCQLRTSHSLAQDERYTLYHPSEIELDEVSDEMFRTFDRVQPHRVALDSLSELRLLARDPLRYRRQILALKQFFAGRACTVLLIDDHAAPDTDAQLESLAHGVIALDMQTVDYGLSRRRLEISKMRGVPFVGGFHDAVIRTGGLVVFPRLQALPGDPPAGQVSSGTPELDALVGGALPWGTTTLLTGPAGSGKSTLASQYVSCALEDGHRVAVFLFEERRRTFMARAEALGMPLREAEQSGRVTISEMVPGSFVPGEFADRVRHAVQEQGVRVVMLDTLNGYLAALPGLAHPVLRLNELLGFLADSHVCTLLVMAQQGLLGASMPVPMDVSYVADTVIMLRFFEASGSVRRAVSVVKKRTGPHEVTIRELQIGPQRLSVGAALTQFQGVLTGVPAYVGASLPPLRHEP